METTQKITMPAAAMFLREEDQTDRIELAAGDKGPARFRMNLYTGAVMKSFWFGKVAVDLDGIKLAKKKIPALREHDRGRIVGVHDNVEISDAGVLSSGKFSTATQDGTEVLELAKEGFPWQASMTAEPVAIESVARDNYATVNGHKVDGPAIIFRKSILHEGSFCVLGADSKTKAIAAAGDRETITCELDGEIPERLASLTIEQNKETDMTTKKKADETAAEPKAKEPEDTFTAEQLELAKKVARAEGDAAGCARGSLEGQTAERERITEIGKLALAGQEQLAAKLVDDGATVEEAKTAFLDAARVEKKDAKKDLKAAAPPPATSGVTGAEGTGTELPGEASLVAEFAKDPERDNFLKLNNGDEKAAFESFCALRKAELNGQVNLRR